MTTSNGFPTVNIHDAMDIWKLGNMAFAWAQQPLALDDSQMELFVDLCRRYSLEPAFVMQNFQRIAWRNLDKAKIDQTFPPSMPVEQASVPPKPSPHPRHAGAGAQQDAPPFVPGETPEAPCGLEYTHPPHMWQDVIEGVPAEWYGCNGEPFVDDDPDKQTGVFATADNDPARYQVPGEWHSEHRDAP